MVSFLLFLAVLILWLWSRAEFGRLANRYADFTRSHFQQHEALRARVQNAEAQLLELRQSGAVLAGPASQPRAEPPAARAVPADAEPVLANPETSAAAALPDPLTEPARPVEARVPSPEFVKDRPAPAARLLDLEETLGANWLLKIGMGILVIGVSLFLGYSVQKLGPWGKVTIGIVVSALAIAGGRILERRQRYETFGRVILSGGWGLAYFTAYAMHHIEAARILESEGAGLAVMLAVAGAMVAQSLKYRSEFVTGFAYGLGFLTLAIHPSGWPAPVAGFILAASAVWILKKLDWYALECFIVAGAYLNHFFWLRPVIAPIGAVKTMFPGYLASSILLAACWALFTVSHFLRRGSGQTQQRYLQAAFILNVGSYLVVSGYQSARPDLAFGFFLVLGVVHGGLAWLSRRLDRQDSYKLTSTIGAALVAAAIPYRFSGNSLALIWLAQAQALLAAGYRLRELHLKRLAWAAAGLLFLYLGFYKVPAALSGTQPKTFEDGVTLGVAGLAFCITALILHERRGSAPAAAGDPAELLSVPGYLFSGWFFLSAAAWFLVPDIWLAPAWMLFAFLLYGSHRRFDSPFATAAAHASAAVALFRTLMANVAWIRPDREFDLEAGIVLAMGLLLHLYAQLARGNTGQTQLERQWQRALGGSAGTLVLLLFLEFSLPWTWTSAAWAGLALALAAGSHVPRFSDLEFQAVPVAVLAALHSAAYSVRLHGGAGWWNERIAAVGLAAALFLAGYGVLRTRGDAADGWGGFRRLVSNGRLVFFFSAAALVALLLLQETEGRGYLTCAWAVEGLAVFVFGVAASERTQRLAGMGLLLLCTAKVVLLDVWLLETLERIFAFIVLGAALVAVSFFYTRYRESWRKILLGS